MHNNAVSSPVNSVPVPPREDLEAAFRTLKQGRVPSIPTVVLELNRELASREPSLERAARLVAEDPAVAGAVLGLVNSPAYGTRVPVESLHHAITLLGLTKVANLVTAESLSRAMASPKAEVTQIWESSVEEARAAVAIARLIDGLEPDEAYLFGMMHDVGNLVLAAQHPDVKKTWDLHAQAPVTMIARERREYGTDHVTLGYLLAKHWKMSDRFALAIYHHHVSSCASFGDPELRTLIAVAKLANCLASQHLRTHELPEMLQYRLAARRELMISDEDWDRLRDEALQGFSS